MAKQLPLGFPAVEVGKDCVSEPVRAVLSEMRSALLIQRKEGRGQPENTAHPISRIRMTVVFKKATTASTAFDGRSGSDDLSTEHVL